MEKARDNSAEYKKGPALISKAKKLQNE